MVELKERAQKRILDIQSKNREKSLLKIKELTEGHAQKKQGDIDVKMDFSEAGESGDESLDEETKKGGSKSENKYKNKGAVSEDKRKNKREYKEARKNIKIKKGQGVMDK